MGVYLNLASLTLALSALAFFWWILVKKRAYAGIYDYLELLSYQVWKSGSEIKEEMEKLKGGWLPHSEVYQSLARLEKEGFVERRIRDNEVECASSPNEKIRIKTHEFKLTSNGIQQKGELAGVGRQPFLPAAQPAT